MPSRARRLSALLVFDHAGVDEVGESAFEGAHGLGRGLAGGLAPVEVGTAFGGVTQLDDGQ